jgi:hypothetical protein
MAPDRSAGHQDPRISAEFLEEEKRTLGTAWYEQEYCCSFEALEGMVYPTFSSCLVDIYLPVPGRLVGGIDWGFHNPFAAVWGVLDKNDVLWIIGERYAREKTLADHLQHLPKDCRWYADPAGAQEIAELRAAGYLVSRGDNAIRAGIAAVTSRIQTGRLKVVSYGAPNLCAEAQLYRYPRPDEKTVQNENPIDENNHALAALRYLVTQLDRKFVARFRRANAALRQEVDSPTPQPGQPAKPPVRNWWLDPRNPELWTPLD